MTRAVMVCSQWGKHPHELDPPHEATGVARMKLSHGAVEIFSMCQRCANEGYLNTGWPRYYKPDKRFAWIQKPWKKGA